MLDASSETFEDSTRSPSRTTSQGPPPRRPTFGYLLSSITNDERTVVRQIEKTLYKINSAKSALIFNYTCIKEGLLPGYTRLRLHDPDAAADNHTITFRRRLLERQHKEKEDEVKDAKQKLTDLHQQWQDLQDGDRADIHRALDRLQEADYKKKELTILRKLNRLNGGKLRLPQQRQSYINLTEYTPTQDEEALLQLGLNCHYAHKPSDRTKRLEIEVLLDSITTLEKEKKITTSDALRPLLLAEALTSRHPHHHRSLLTKDLKDAAKKLRQAEGVTIRRADKTPALVLIDTEEYHGKLDGILSDDTKFKKIRKNPIEDIKREANALIDGINAATNAVKFLKIKGDFEPGYIYGNIKTHKARNPLRPIISQIPTPTYALAKHLNRILTPYIPDEHRVKSSAAFLQIIKDSSAEGAIASLDVESLFTNVPVAETIDLICDRVYRDDTTPTLAVPENALRRLLQLCTMSAPFVTHRGDLYTQVDGVAMGSPLGVLFADFYMGVVEQRVFNNHPKPAIYCRYVDDTFVKASSFQEIEQLRQKFEECSTLRFTCEQSEGGTLPFLDISVHQNDTTFSTDVYRKGTNLGLCLNGKSECPERYRRSTITSYIRRALTHCSTWSATSKEIDISSQILINNGFSNKEIERQTRKLMDEWYAGNHNDRINNDPPDIRLFYKSQYHTNYKRDEKAIKEIIKENIKPTSEEQKVKLIIYYKNRKTASLIMKNNPAPQQDKLRKRNVIYLYQCPVPGCTGNYVGMTTMRLSKRISCHLQEGAIKNHLTRTHNTSLSRQQLIDSIDVIDVQCDKKRLRFLEALHILDKKPSINCTDEPLLLPSLLTPVPSRPHPHL